MLSPCESATHFTQEEKVVTVSLIVPCVKGMKKQLASLGKNLRQDGILNSPRSIVF